MKITGTTNYIRVEYEGRIVKFDGEMVMNGFFADSNTIRWEPPFNSITISNETKNKIIKEIIEETEHKDFRIFLE